MHIAKQSMNKFRNLECKKSFIQINPKHRICWAELMAMQQKNENRFVEKKSLSDLQQKFNWVWKSFFPSCESHPVCFFSRPMKLQSTNPFISDFNSEVLDLLKTANAVGILPLEITLSICNAMVLCVFWHATSFRIQELNVNSLPSIWEFQVASLRFDRFLACCLSYIYTMDVCIHNVPHEFKNACGRLTNNNKRGGGHFVWTWDVLPFPQKKKRKKNRSRRISNWLSMNLELWFGSQETFERIQWTEKNKNPEWRPTGTLSTNHGQLQICSFSFIFSWNQKQKWVQNAQPTKNGNPFCLCVRPQTNHIGPIHGNPASIQMIKRTRSWVEWKQHLDNGMGTRKTRIAVRALPAHSCPWMNLGVAISKWIGKLPEDQLISKLSTKRKTKCSCPEKLSVKLFLGGFRLLQASLFCNENNAACNSILSACTTLILSSIPDLQVPVPIVNQHRQSGSISDRKSAAKSKSHPLQKSIASQGKGKQIQACVLDWK